MSLNLHLWRETNKGEKIAEFPLYQTPTKVTTDILDNNGKNDNGIMYGKDPCLTRYIAWVHYLPSNNLHRDHINNLINFIKTQEENTKGKFCWFLS